VRALLWRIDEPSVPVIVLLGVIMFGVVSPAGFMKQRELSVALSAGAAHGKV